MGQIKHVTLSSGALEATRDIVVDTISDLRGMTAAYPVVVVRGHTTAGDGGGGEFWYVGASAAPGDIDSAGDDDNGFHIVNSSGLLWQRQSDVVTPQMFGAFPASTSAAARTASDQADAVQRAVNFWIYPGGFGGTAHVANPIASRSMEFPHGFYRCESTINFHFNKFAGETNHGYRFSDYYVPGPCTMHGDIWTPYSTDITAISLKQEWNFSCQRLQLNAVKDTVNDTTYAKRWATVTWPKVYVDDTVLRTWANSTKFYRDEDIKYVSSYETYIIRCTETGTTASATPSDLSGASFTSGGKFYCRGKSRIANSGANGPGKNMDEMFNDTLDVGIHVSSASNLTGVSLSAFNYAVGVKMNPKGPWGIAWSDFDVPRATGCKCGVYINSWRADRRVELGGRLLLKDMPVGSIVWETAYPLSIYNYLPWKEWSSGGSVALNDIVRYKINHPTGYHQDGSANGQYWCWRVTNAGDGTLGTTAPTSTECTTTPWDSGGVTLVCIGSYFGTRYIYNGGGESTSGNWTDPGSTYQQTIDLGWVNDNTFRPRYVSPRIQGSGSIGSTDSTYGIVFSGEYAANNNHFDMIDHSALQLSNWTLCEAAEVVMYSGTSNTFHMRQESSHLGAAMLCQMRHPGVTPSLNLFQSARFPDIAQDAPTYRRHRGAGAGNMLLGPAYQSEPSASFDVDFSKMLHYSSYDYIYGHGIGFIAYDTSSTLTYTPYVLAGLTSDADGPMYNYDDDSWQFKGITADGVWPGVIVDLTNDITASYLIRVTVKLGNITYGTSRWWRWMLNPLEEDGITKLDPALIADSTVGTGTYASVALVQELTSGSSWVRPQQTASQKVIYDHALNYHTRILCLAINPLVKKFAFGIRGKRLKGWKIEVLGSPGARIYAPVYDGNPAVIGDYGSIRAVDVVPAKGRISSPAIFRYVSGAATEAFAKFRGSDGEVYWCTSGVTTSLTPSTNRMWGHNGGSQGSATIREWDGSTWTDIATNAYYTEPTGTYFENIPSS